MSPSISAVIFIRLTWLAVWSTCAPVWATSRRAALGSPLFRGFATTMTPSVSWSKTRGAMRSGGGIPGSPGPGLIRLWAVSACRSWRFTSIWDSAAKPISPVSSGTSVPTLTAAPSG